MFKRLRLKLREKTATVIQFACSIGGFYVSSPVLLARKFVPKWYKEQLEQGIIKFVRCPGMHDFMTQGYLIVAHADIHIRASKHSAHCFIEGTGNDSRLNVVTMDYDIVRGMVPVGDIKPTIFKVPIPFGIHMPEGYACHVLPAHMHFPEMYKKIFVFPGSVDYGNRFHHANFIFSPIEEMEDFVIPQGTPLLHVLPHKLVAFHGISGPATKLQSDRHLFSFTTRVMGAYRRKFLVKKTYTIEEIK